MTDGFRISNINKEIPYDTAWEMKELDSGDAVALEEALNQPYYYLDKGHQVYAFESKDHKYVIKFLKLQRLRIPHWASHIPISFVNNWFEKKRALKQGMLHGLLTSWKIGFEHLKEESATVYVHINPSHTLQKHLTLYDKIGKKHQLDLDKTVFLIQKKVQPLIPALQQMGQSKEAYALMDELIALFLSEYKRGFAEKELYIMRNMGVYEGKIVHVDSGRLERDESLIDPENRKKELIRKTVKWRAWLQENYPELAAYFEKQLELNI
jgi:hypothetical protein